MQVVLPTHVSQLIRGLATVGVLGAVAACGAPAPAEPPEPAPAAAQSDATAPGGAEAGGAEAGGASGHGHGSLSGLYAVQTGPLGVIATDGEGRIVYRRDTDTPTTSTCTDACAEEWLPVLAPEGRELELLGVDEELVGLLARPEGRQLTLAGWPLYHRADDSGLLDSTGRNGAEGIWFAITPDGEKATPTP